MPGTPHLLQDTALRYFLEVARRGSVSDAAQVLHVTASAVSRQVSMLEQSLGASLFERHPRGMRTTAAGELLAAHARRMSLDAAEVIAAIDAMQGMRSGHLRLGSTGGFAIDLLPSAIALFRQAHPGIRFSLSVGMPADVTRQLLDGETDIGITYSRIAHKGIHVPHAQSASVVIVMPPDHPLSGQDAVTLHQIRHEAIALPGPDTTVRQLFDIACSNRQIAFEPVLECSQFETLLNFVRRRGGLSIAGAASVRHLREQGQLHAAQLREPGMRARTIQIQTLAGRNLPPSASAFITLLAQQLRAIK